MKKRRTKVRKKIKLEVVNGKGHRDINTERKRLIAKQEKRERKVMKVEETPSPFANIPQIKKRKYLTAFALCGKIHESERLSGIHHHYHYCWLKEDSDYAEAFEVATQMAANRMEDEIRRRAFDGTNDPVVYQGEISGVWVNEEGQQVTKGTPGAVLVPLTVKKYSDNLAMITIKRLIPEYRDSTPSGPSINISADQMFLSIHQRATESKEIDVTHKIEGPKQDQDK